MVVAMNNPFDIALTDEQRTTLAVWCSEQVQAALNVRGTQESEVEYWHQLYEQARTRLGRNAPWPDAADLTSYIACEKVDAIVARGMRTVWSTPVWTVEGWGTAADRAPFVEEFHQWKVEEERLQNVLDRLWLISMIEPRGLLEIYEDVTQRTVRKTIHAQIARDPLTGMQLYGEDGMPELAMDQHGQYLEVTDPDHGAAETVIDSTEQVRLGPQYRVLPYRDSIILPGHARERQEIWGYGKRFWKRFPDLVAQASGPHALYHKASVESLTAVGDRQSDPALARSQQGVAPQDEITAEKELWECTLLLDLNVVLESRNEKPIRGLKGARWYVVTLHIDQHTLLRLQHDDLERSRYVPVILFPRPDRATEGFSFIGHKLITTIEEHTAWRNMSADRGSMVLQAPIKRMQGALWDPQEQPFGPKAVIDVRDMREIEPVQLPEFGLNYADARIQSCERTAERLAGVNDIASGQVSAESRTLGEVNMATEQSFVRMDLIVRRFQEAMEDIAQIRHAIWKRTLASQPDGVEAPRSLMQGLEGRGVAIEEAMPDKKVTAALLEGAFRFRPYGSVQTADPSRRRADLMAFMDSIGKLGQAFPVMGQMLANPAAGRALFREFLQAFAIPNRQVFLGSPAQDLAQQQMMPPQMPMMGMGGGIGPPGTLPPGMPDLASRIPSTNTLQ